VKIATPFQEKFLPSGSFCVAPVSEPSIQILLRCFPGLKFPILPEVVAYLLNEIIMCQGIYWHFVNRG